MDLDYCAGKSPPMQMELNNSKSGKNLLTDNLDYTYDSSKLIFFFKGE
jgi:hypothetical protein